MIEPSEFSGPERFELLKIELQILQTRFDKYNDLIWRNRNWMVTVTLGFVGWAIAQGALSATRPALLWVAAVVPLVFWFNEVTLRFAYMSKYVHRYRVVRDSLNGRGDDSWQSLPVYDVTNSIQGRPLVRRITDSIVALEPFVFYAAVILLVRVAAGFL